MLFLKDVSYFTLCFKVAVDPSPGAQEANFVLAYKALYVHGSSSEMPSAPLFSQKVSIQPSWPSLNLTSSLDSF